MNVSEKTRLLLGTYAAEVAALNGIDAGRIDFRSADYFDVAPTVQQSLYSHMTEDTGFLNRVNRVPVDEMTGQKVGMSANNLLVRNVDTSQPGVIRTGVDPVTLDGSTYQLRKSNYDVRLPYARLDLWAKFPDFSRKISDHSLICQAQDRIRVGFNGVAWSPQSDPVAHPMGEDINRGWLQEMREDNAQRWLTHGGTPARSPMARAAISPALTIWSLPRATACLRGPSARRACA
jgi:hypothetical protein